MKKHNATGTERLTEKFSTEEVSVILKVAPQTLRAALCRSGHYLGMRPVKLPNGRLLWDASAVESMISGEESGQ